MKVAASGTDPWRPRLQLGLGSIAQIAEEIPGPSQVRTFAANARDGGRPLVITVHLPPPDGPDGEQFDRRMAALRDLGHGVFDLPVASGNVDGRCWVAEEVPSLPSANERLLRGPISLHDAVSGIRDLARALAAMHRRELFHGAINLDAVRVGDGGARLGQLCHGMGGSVRGDLDALGLVAWALLTGEREYGRPRRLSQVRRGVSPELDKLCAMLMDADASRRPQRAEAVLDGLDAVPGRRVAPTGFDGASERSGRRPVEYRWMAVGIAVLLALLLFAALRR